MPRFVCLDNLCFHHLCTNPPVCPTFISTNSATELTEPESVPKKGSFPLTVIDRLLVDDSSFGKAIQVIQLYLLPRYVRDTQVHIPKLLVLLLYTFVQSPRNLDQRHTKGQDYYYCFLIVASCNIQPCAPKSKASLFRTTKEHNGINCIGNVDLDDLGANLKRSGAELLTGTVCILPVDHTDVGTPSGRDHLQRDTRTRGKKDSKTAI